MRSIVIFVLGTLLIGVVYGGASGSAALEELAQFGSEFARDETGRFDAALFLACCLVLAPFAALAVMLVGFPVTVVALESTVFPLSRRMGISDGVALLTAMAIGVPITLTQTDIPIWSIQAVGTFVRAWIAVTT